jgi:hypothetical protein
MDIRRFFQENPNGVKKSPDIKKLGLLNISPSPVLFESTSPVSLKTFFKPTVKGSPNLNENCDPPTIRKIRIKIRKIPTESVGVSSGAPAPTISEANSLASIKPKSFLDFSEITEELERTVREESQSQSPTPESPKSKSPTTKSASPKSSKTKSVDVSLEASVPITCSPKEVRPPWFYQVRHFDLKKTPSLMDFCLNRDFAKVAYIVSDTEVRKDGKKARQTLLQFSPTVPKQAWEEKGQYIYLFVVNGRIVKIGCTRTSISARCGSYLAGHGIPEVTGGTAGSTNAFIYWTFVWLLSCGKKIEMYAAELPKAVVVQSFFGFEEKIETQVCHRWERRVMIEFEKQFGRTPPLSSNYDPSD